jgi:hypothetical protein
MGSVTNRRIGLGLCLGATLGALALAACRDTRSRTLPAAEDAPPAGTRITLLYSSNLLGEYEPCG